MEDSFLGMLHDDPYWETAITVPKFTFQLQLQGQVLFSLYINKPKQIFGYFLNNFIGNKVKKQEEKETERENK